MNDQELTWDNKGVERMEYFVAEGMTNHLLDEAMQEWSYKPENLTGELRCVRGDDAPDFLRMTPAEAGIVMASMMRDHLAKLIVPDSGLWGHSKDAIERAIKDEDYDREFKAPEEYEIP